MHVAAHQERKKNEKKGAGEVRKQSTNLREAACCSRSEGQHSEKIVCVRRVPGMAVTLGKANIHFDPTQTGLGTAPPC